LLAVRLETTSLRFTLALLYLLEAGLMAGLVLVSRHFSLPILLVLAACDGLLAIAAAALTRSALATTLADENLLREGNALLNLVGMIIIAGGPAISGLLVASRGVASALELDAATFVVASFAIVTANELRIASDEDSSFSDRLRGGMTTLRTLPSVTRLLVAISLVVGLGSIAIPVEVVFAKSTLHAGDSGYGVLLTSWGIGMILGSFTFATARRLSFRFVLSVGTMLIAIGYAGLAAAPTLAVACCFSFVGGAGNAAAWGAARTALQGRIPLNRQSALMAVLEASNQLMPAVGFVVGGAITALSSPRVAYALSAAGVAAVLLVFTIRSIDGEPVADIPQQRSHDATPQGVHDAQETEASARTNYSPTSTFG
jgi:hypothetical protein